MKEVQKDSMFTKLKHSIWDIISIILCSLLFLPIILIFFPGNVLYRLTEPLNEETLENILVGYLTVFPLITFVVSLVGVIKQNRLKNLSIISLVCSSAFLGLIILAFLLQQLAH